MKMVGIEPDKVKAILNSDVTIDEDKKNELLASLIEEKEIGEDYYRELEVYAEFMALTSWKVPAKRKDMPESHFFWPEEKKLPFRNLDDSINYASVMAAWCMANGTCSDGQKAPSSVIDRIKPEYDACMSKPSKKHQENFSHSTFTLSSTSDQPIILKDVDGKKMSTIQMLKMGTFEHPMWGRLEFNTKVFGSFIKNFNSGIPQNELALDFKHMSENGAAAWIKKVFSKSGGLFFEVEWTPKGQQSVEDKEFKFTSVEYVEQYKDRESNRLHGPTILGGGLTNRPFIKGMSPIAMSEDGETIFEFKEINEDRGGESMKTLEEIKGIINGINVKVTELSEKITAKPDDKDLIKEMTNLTKELSEANEELKTFKVDDKSAEFNKLETTNVKLTDDIKALSDTIKSLLGERQVEKRQFYVSQVEKKLGEFKVMGVPPAMIEAVKPLLLTEDAAKVVIKLQDKDGKEQTITLTNAVQTIFESLPDEAKVDLTEITEIEKNKNLGDKLDVDAVSKYADEKKITFADALIALQKEGKLTTD